VRLPLSQNCLKYYFKPFSSIAADRSGPCSIWAGERSGFGMLPKIWVDTAGLTRSSRRRF
jgi:hypothetical protein